MYAIFDGKGMLAMHHQAGRKCWLCDADVSVLQPLSGCTAVLRYGAFLPSIPLERRVGDYVHAACRIVNIILKRLVSEDTFHLTQVVRE